MMQPSWFHFLALISVFTTSCAYRWQTTAGELFEIEGVRKVYVAEVTNLGGKPGVEKWVRAALVRRLNQYREIEIVQFEEDADTIVSASVGDVSMRIARTTSAKDLNYPGYQLGRDTKSVAAAYQAGLGVGFSIQKKTDFKTARKLRYESERRQALKKGAELKQLEALEKSYKTDIENLEKAEVLAAAQLNSKATIPDKGQKKEPQKNYELRTLWSGSFSRSMEFPANSQLGVRGTTAALINESEWERSLIELSDLISVDMAEAIQSRF